MIDPKTIGNAIRELRKERKISQEKMAEDLNMYQADISNLERGLGGSGINDIYKLDMIADYFGVELMDILIGAKVKEPVMHEENNNEESSDSGDATLLNAQFHPDIEYSVAEVEVETPNKQILYYSIAISIKSADYFKSDHSIYSELDKRDPDKRLPKALQSLLLHSEKNRTELLKAISPTNLSVLRYLLLLIEDLSDENAESFLKKTKNQTFSQMELPLPSCEPAGLYHLDYEDLAVVYRYRLMLESMLKNPHVFMDMGESRSETKALLKKLNDACISEKAYRVWKKDILDAKAEEVTRKEKLMTCSYFFIGMGSYKETLPESMVEGFKNWVNGNGSAFFTGCEPATKPEIRNYVALHLFDEYIEENGLNT